MTTRLPPPGPPPPLHVASASFYIAEVRHRVNEVGAELARLRKKFASVTRAQGQYAVVLQEVRALEGVLADYNLAFDKLRTSLDPAKLHLYHQQLQARNAEEARVVEDLVRNRQRLERKAAAWAEERARAGAAAEDGARRYLDPSRYQLYQELQQQHQLLEAEARAQRNEDEDEEEEEERHFRALEARLRQLERERRYLKEEGAIAMLRESNPRQAQAWLLAKVKEENLRAAEVEARCQRLREELAQTKAAGGRGGRTEAQHRLQELDDLLRQARQEQHEAQQAVDTLVEFLEEGRRRKEEEVEEINPRHDDYTRMELQAERTRRLQELEKLSQVDERITVELGNLRRKAEVLRQEMDGWGAVQEWVGQQREGGPVAGKDEGCGALKAECLGLVARLNALHCERVAEQQQQQQQQRRVVG